jgi:type VI secretion system protein VasI
MSRSIALCFFAVFFAFDASAQAPVALQGWTRTEGKSQMDDSPTVTLRLLAQTEAQGFLKTTRPSLIIRCKERRTDLYVVTGLSANPEVGLFESHSIRYRIDQDPAVPQTWDAATSDDALFAPVPIELARQISKGKTFLFEFTPFRSSPVIARFNVTGLERQLGRVAEACDWKAYDDSKEEIRLKSEALHEQIRLNEEAAVERERLGSLMVGDPAEFHSFKFPVPKGARVTLSETAPQIEVFEIATIRAFNLFYRTMMERYGYKPGDSEPNIACWTNDKGSACLDFRTDNRVKIRINEN